MDSGTRQPRDRKTPRARPAGGLVLAVFLLLAAVGFHAALPRTAGAGPVPGQPAYIYPDISRLRDAVEVFLDEGHYFLFLPAGSGPHSQVVFEANLNAARRLHDAAARFASELEESLSLQGFGVPGAKLDGSGDASVSGFSPSRRGGTLPWNTAGGETLSAVNSPAHVNLLFSARELETLAAGVMGARENGAGAMEGGSGGRLLESLIPVPGRSPTASGTYPGRGLAELESQLQGTVLELRSELMASMDVYVPPDPDPEPFGVTRVLLAPAAVSRFPVSTFSTPAARNLPGAPAAKISQPPCGREHPFRAAQRSSAPASS